jgi:RNAse (barnase) inhibitor barstar
MISWLKRQIKRWKNPHDLIEEDALIIYNILMESGDEDLIQKVNNALKVRAESRMGLYAIALSWNGTLLNDNVERKIKRHFSFADLYRRNLTALLNPAQIELGVLASRLPKELVMKHFHFDMEEEARKAGVSLDTVKQILEKYVLKIENDKWRVYFDRNAPQEELILISPIIGSGHCCDDGNTLYMEGDLVYSNVKKLMGNHIFKEKFDFLSSESENG